MKLLRLLILSVLILYLTFLLQNIFDGGQWAVATPSLVHRSDDAKAVDATGVLNGLQFLIDYLFG